MAAPDFVAFKETPDAEKPVPPCEHCDKKQIVNEQRIKYRDFRKMVLSLVTRPLHRMLYLKMWEYFLPTVEPSLVTTIGDQHFVPYSGVSLIWGYF